MPTPDKELMQHALQKFMNIGFAVNDIAIWEKPDKVAVKLSLSPGIIHRHLGIRKRILFMEKDYPSIREKINQATAAIHHRLSQLPSFNTQ